MRLLVALVVVVVSSFIFFVNSNLSCLISHPTSIVVPTRLEDKHLQMITIQSVCWIMLRKCHFHLISFHSIHWIDGIRTNRLNVPPSTRYEDLWTHREENRIDIKSERDREKEKVHEYAYVLSIRILMRNNLSPAM